MSINKDVSMSAIEYHHGDDHSVIMTIGVYGATSTYYISTEQARVMAQSLLDAANNVEQAEAKIEEAA